MSTKNQAPIEVEWRRIRKKGWLATLLEGGKALLWGATAAAAYMGVVALLLWPVFRASGGGFA